MKKVSKHNIIIKAPSKGESMIPIIKDNCTLEINTRRNLNYSIGDIVVRIEKGVLIAHRIVGIKSKNNKLTYLLKGDNNFEFDGYFKKKYFVGKVERIFHKSYDIDLLSVRNSYTKYIFVLYSLLKTKKNRFISYRKLSENKLAKHIYKRLVCG